MPDTNPPRPGAAPADTVGTTVSHAADGHFETGLRAFFGYRDLGIRAATAGGFTAHVIRAIPGQHAQAIWHTHDLGFQFVFCLKGWVRFEYADIGEVTLLPGDSVYQPPLIRHREVAHSEDLELLEITSPADFATAVVPPA
jgi:quercetin dioxygenase-like cupin family protein